MVVGELKGFVKNGNGFSDDAKGQLLGFLEKVINTQKFRFSSGQASATGFLSDGKHIQFFKLVTDPSFAQIEWHESSHLAMDGAGGLAFLGLLRADLTSLGYKMPELSKMGWGQDVRVTRVLGVGSTATVYAVQDSATREIAVAKLFLPGMEERLQSEVANLDLVSSLGARVTRLLVKPPRGATVLFLTPIGTPFACRPRDIADACTGKLRRSLARMSWQHFCDIIETVRQMHELRVIHRDLSLSNVFDIAGSNTVVKVCALRCGL